MTYIETYGDFAKGHLNRTIIIFVIIVYDHNLENHIELDSDIHYDTRLGSRLSSATSEVGMNDWYEPDSSLCSGSL